MHERDRLLAGKLSLVIACSTFVVFRNVYRARLPSSRETMPQLMPDISCSRLSYIVLSSSSSVASSEPNLRSTTEEGHLNHCTAPKGQRLRVSKRTYVVVDVVKSVLRDPIGQACFGLGIFGIPYAPGLTSNLGAFPTCHVTCSYFLLDDSGEYAWSRRPYGAGKHYEHSQVLTSRSISSSCRKADSLLALSSTCFPS